MHELDAAVMVVDVSGFSGMCEQFAQGFVPDGGWRQRMKVSFIALERIRCISLLYPIFVSSRLPHASIQASSPP